MSEMIIHEEPAMAPPVPISSAAKPLQDRLLDNKDLIKAMATQIKKHHLTGVGGKSYMNVGGGIAVAQALGYTISCGPVERVTGEDSCGFYRSTASLIDHNGIVVATAEGYLGDDEQMWANRPLYARRSMCQTRSEAKLCRANFGALYIMLGADSDTPAEEMSGTSPVPAPSQQAPTHAAPARPATATVPSGDNVFTIVDVEVFTGVSKKTGKEFTKFTVVSAEGEKFSTFREDAANAAREAMSRGLKAKIDYVAGQWGNDLKSLILVKSDEPEVEVLDGEEVPW